MPANVDEVINLVSNPSGRLFGVEIEALGQYPAEVANMLAANGISVRAENYNHTLRDHWKVTTDGSLSSSQSCEVVSPPLAFTLENLRLVAKVVELLRNFGCRIDDSCGLHVHVNSRDIQGFPHFARVLFLLYRENEEKIDSFVTEGRRANQNRFCRTLKNHPRGANFSTLSGDRYQKLNFDSFSRHGTVEFRQHHGTLNETKVVAWIIFCVQFFEHGLRYYQANGNSETRYAHRWA